MNLWPRTIGRSLIVLLWLFFITLPLLAFLLAAQKQITLGSEETYLRLQLLQDKDAEGISLELARPSFANSSCTQTTVRYFMWTGQPQNVDFCQCTDQQTGYALPIQQGSCSPH